MKLVKFVLFFLYTVAYSVSYAEANSYVIVGQRNAEGQASFCLGLSEQHIQNSVYITENGDVYLKVDSIFAKNGSGEIETLYGRKEQPKKWQCPYCYHWWELGEKCMNPNCPSNRWPK